MRVLLVLVLLLGSATAAAADTITYWIEIEWTSGPLSGQTDVGSGTYDDAGLTGSGSEYVSPTFGALTFDIVVDGTAFDETEDTDYASYPQLGFFDGVATNFDFVVTDSVLETGFFGTDGAVYDHGDSVESWGTLSFHLTDPSPVPEPASLALFGLGAAGLAAHRRRRRRPT